MPIVIPPPYLGTISHVFGLGMDLIKIGAIHLCICLIEYLRGL